LPGDPRDRGEWIANDGQSTTSRDEETRGKDVVKLDVIDSSEGPVAVEALRQDAAAALERALAFVEAHADELARLRTHALLGLAPTDRVVEALAERQQASGAFLPLGLAQGGALGFERIGEGAIDAALLGTLEALVILGDLDALHAEPIQAAAAHLERVQTPSGAWGPEDLVLDERLFLTGALGGLLGRTRIVRPSVHTGAGDFLGAHWSPDRVENANWQAIVGFGIFYSHVGDDLSDEALQWVGRELERGYRMRRFDAAQVLRALMHCDAAAIPGASLTPFELLRQLVGEQSSDGGFAQLAPVGPAGRLSPTIDAMGAILKICRVL
jgi:hypothetical protein